MSIDDLGGGCVELMRAMVLITAMPHLLYLWSECQIYCELCSGWGSGWSLLQCVSSR